MRLRLGERNAYFYGGGRELDPAQPTVVFVHGAGLDHSWWLLQSRYFAWHGRNVVALDLPAHGRSEGPPLDSIAAMAQWVLELLARLNVEKAALVGHSMGALVALECAARHPQCAERLALVGVAYPMKVSDAFLDAARRNEHAAYDMETIWGHAAQAPLGANPNPGMWMYGDTLARLERLAPGVLYADLKACNDYRGEPAAVRCPALLLLGGRDVMTPPRGAEALAGELKDCRVVTVAGSGHSLMAEAPDATLDALKAFLR